MGWAQEVATSDQVVQLERFDVADVPIEENIIPSSRPFNSVFGSDRNVVDTPRSVTIISREQLDAISIKTPRDFARLTSSSYTKSNFGAPTSPDLRGQEADLFVNGIRKGLTSNGNGLPINFNSVESVNIVKGPAGAVYGSSNYLGGYADLITKRAFFDRARGSASVTVGSFGTAYGSVDYGAPISDALAYRFSISGEDTEGYYENSHKQTQAIYGTLTFRPSDRYELLLATEFFNATYTENWGMNRPTQDLIDRGLYLPNRGTDADYAAYVARLGNGTSVFSGVPGTTAASVFGGAGFATIVPIDLANPVKLDRRKRLLSPGDDSNGQNFWAQAIQTFRVNDNLKIENNNYFQWIDRNTFSSYHYSELMRDNWSFDNRLSVIVDEETWGINAGVRYRYQDVWSVNHFFNEPANFWDLTRDSDLHRVPDAGFSTDPSVPDEPARGILSRWYYGGTGADTAGYFLGPFTQFNYTFAEKLILDAGYSFDYVKASSKNPVTGAGKITDDTTLNIYNAALTYKVTDLVSVYGSYGFSESFPVDTGGRFNVAGFQTPREGDFLEFGVKTSMLNNTLFGALAWFDRGFTVINPNGSIDQVYVDGVEFEINYQPNRNFYSTFGYSYLNSTRTLGFFATGYTADRAGETGGLYITPTFPSAPGRIFDFPGNPQHQAVYLVSYKWDNGFGLRANVVYTGKYKLGYDGYPFAINFPVIGNFPLTGNTVTIPNQHEIDVTAFYERGDWAFRATLFNATDEDNWDAPNAGYGNDSVVAREPVRVEFTATYKF